MKVLNLIIKQKYFDAILAGRKVQEFREVRLQPPSRSYCSLMKMGLK